LLDAAFIADELTEVHSKECHIRHFR
jgi:hypothetical protein